MIKESLCPSKTFICGEYAVLNGGRGLVLNHEPLFKLDVQQTNSEEFPKWLHPESPAGHLFKKYSNVLQRFRLDFEDPHKGGGGFGASGAQFLLLYRLLRTQEVIGLRASAFEEFKVCDTSGSSGSDILAQDLGEEVVQVAPQQGQSSALSEWPFENLIYLIYPTGVKLNTFDHLKNLNLSSVNSLSEISDSVISAYVEKSEENFIKCISNFRNALLEMQFIAEHSLNWIEKIKVLPGVKTVKGCGALGSDSLLVLCERSKAFDVNNAIQGFDLKLLISNWSEHD